MAELDQIKPTSLAGVKRLAKQIKKRDGCLHAAALDRAARQAGFDDFRSARQTLPTDADTKGGEA